MAIAKKTARQAQMVQAKKQAPVGSGERTLWSFSTSMRNPARLGQILDIVISDQRARKNSQPRVWDAPTQDWIFEQLKDGSHYTEKNRNSEAVSNAGRGRTATSPAAQLGFLTAETGKGLEVTPLGKLYAKALDENDGIMAEDYLLLALSRLRLLVDEQGNAGHYVASHTVKGTPTAPLGHIIDLFLDEGVFNLGGLSLRRANYLIPLAVSEDSKPDLLRLAYSKTFEKDIAATIKGNLKTARDYGDTLVRYLLLSGLFIRDSSTGKDKISIAPGREHQARRIRDALLAPDANAHAGSWNTYRPVLGAAPEGAFPWHGSTQDYESDCHEIANVILTLTGQAPDYDSSDRKAHITLRQQLGEVQERKYISSGQSLKDFPNNIKLVRGATEKKKHSGKTISPLNFEAAVLRAGTALSNIGRFAPNYLKDNNNKPIAHAPGKDGDGWIHGQGPKGPHLLLEASLQGGRAQALTEWQPAVRHLTTKKLDGQLLDPEHSAGLLVMTSLHEDTIGMCVRDSRCLHLQPEFRDTPAYLLPLTHTQYARLIEPTVVDTTRLATLEEMVEWIKSTCLELGRQPNVRDVDAFGAFMDQAIDQWRDQMLERAAQQVPAATRKLKR